MPSHDEQFDQLPPAIIDALRDLDGPAIPPDAQRDAELMTNARQHLAGIAQAQRRHRNIRLFFAGSAGGALAAAAMIAFVVFIGNPLATQDEPDLASNVSPPALQNTIPMGDLDASGNVDILDAYLLAKRLDQGDTTNAHDYNADGQADQLDIDWIANQAVALSTGERQ